MGDTRDTRAQSSRTSTHPVTTQISWATHPEMVPTPISEPRDQTSETPVKSTSQKVDTELVDRVVSTTYTLETTPLSPTASSLAQTPHTSLVPSSTQSQLSWTKNMLTFTTTTTHTMASDSEAIDLTSHQSINSHECMQAS